MPIWTEEEYLEHYGRRGMKWYQHKFGDEDSRAKYADIKAQGDELNYGLKNLKGAKTANMDQWGRSPNTNVCYIAGYSGSGKSTTARSIAKNTDKIIHLDLYSEPGNDNDKDRDKDFDRYLSKKVPNYKEVADPKNMKRYSEEYWDLVSNFSKAIEDYGAEQYKKGNKVVVEGVQIADDWLHPREENFYSNRPLITMTTNPVSSIQRAFARDGRGGLIKGFKGLDDTKEYVNWYIRSSKNLKELSSSAGAKRGQKWVEDYLK